MSRTYRIVVREALSRCASAEDRLVSSLELLPLLPPERMAHLVSEALEVRGFERHGEVLRRRERAVRSSPGAAVAQRAAGTAEADPSRDGGVVLAVEIDPRTGAVTIAAEGHEALALAEERSTASVTGRREQVEASLAAATRSSLVQRADAAEAALRREVTAALELRLPELRIELDALVTQVTAAALKERAAELGEIDSIVEQEDGGLVIRVRV